MLDMQALHGDNACKLKKRNQYTIRNVPDRVDGRLRESAAEYGTSLNSTALRALSRGLDLETEPVIHHDLDDLAGTWVQDDGFDRAMAEMDQIDPELWT